MEDVVDDAGRTPNVRTMRFLDEDGKRAILDGALTILADVGMVVQHPEAQVLLERAGCRVDGDGLAFVPERLVRQSLASVPPVVTLYDRGGAPAMALGGRRSYFGTGSDLLWTSDLETGERRRSSLADVARAAQLVDRLPNMDFAMSSAYPNEVDPHEACLRSFAAMVASTTKPLVVVNENGDDLRRVRDVAAVIRGGREQLRQKPYFVVYAEPVSPLQHPFDSIDKVLVSARAGLPCIYMPTPLTGATAPITVAGYMAQGTAEALFGLVVHQLCRSGAPFIYGHGHAVLDMHTAQSCYNAVDGYLIELGMVEMAKWLDLPNFANSGATDSQLVDAQAGMDIAAETLLMLQAGSNLNHNAGYLDFGLTGSLETVVITDEVIALNRRLLNGIEISSETLALEVIASVGPGGHYLDQRHTRRNLRTSHWRPTILNRQGREAWAAQGGLDLRERARHKALALLDKPACQPLAPHLAMAIEALVESFAGHNGDGQAKRVAAVSEGVAAGAPESVDQEVPS
jgi:trimethylamine--corrinoid protein Co-methyltransferase